jgi:hypothetical protein
MAMTSDEFIRRIRMVVYDSMVRGTIALLEKPPGRRPHQGLVRLSQWFNQLSPEDKDYVEKTIQLSVRDAIFQFLTVLDGVVAFREADEEPGSFELWYKTPEESVLLNGPRGEFLHDIFAAEVPPE